MSSTHVVAEGTAVRSSDAAAEGSGRGSALAGESEVTGSPDEDSIGAGRREATHHQIPPAIHVSTEATASSHLCCGNVVQAASATSMNPVAASDQRALLAPIFL